MIKLLERRGDKLVSVWELSAEEAATLDTKTPVDLHLEMTKAINCLDGLLIDALFLADRPGRFWMDAQGMRRRHAFVTSPDLTGVPHDYFKGVRIAVTDGGRQEARAAETAFRQRAA